MLAGPLGRGIYKQLEIQISRLGIQLRTSREIYISREEKETGAKS